MPGSMDKRGANNVYFDFCKVFDLTSWNIHIPKLVMHGLDKWMLKGVKFTDNFLFKNLQGDQTPQRGYKISALGHVQNSTGDPFPEGS